MRRHPRLLLPLVLVSLVACSPLVGIEEVSLDPTFGKGGSGQGGSLAGSAGAAGSDAGQGGAGGAGAAGAGQGGAGTAGTGGASGAGAGGSAGSSGAGNAGSAGSAGTAGEGGSAGSGGNAGSAGSGGAGSGGAGSGGEAGAGQSGASGSAGASGAGGAGAGGAGAGGAGAGGSAGAGAGGSAGGGAAGAGGSGSTCDDVVYVSPNGDDANEGCQKDKPKKTLSGAVNAAETLKKAEVHACQGTYSEDMPVRVSPGLALRGGYDCTTWVTLSGTLSASLDNKTIVQRKGDADPQKGTTVILSGSSSGPVTELQGFTVVGAQAVATIGDYGSTAVLVEGMAGLKAKISYSVLQGGTGAANVGRTAGLVAGANTQIELHHSRISGGKGQSGSAGVLLDLSSGQVPSIHDNVIYGGDGEAQCTAEWASVGLYAKGSGKLGDSAGPIKTNAIVGGQGKRASGCKDALATAAVLLAKDSSVSAYLQENALDAGASAGEGRMAGFEAQGSGAVVLLRNRIYGGSASAPSASLSAAGVVSSGSSSIEISTNMILGGNATNQAIGSTTGVQLGSGAATLLHNTIHAGGLPPGGLATALHLPKDLPSLSLRDNQLLAPALASGDSNRAIYTEACSSKLTDVPSNLFLNGPKILVVQAADPCALAASYDAVDAITPYIDAQKTMGWVRLGGCSGPPSCTGQSCPPPTCAPLPSCDGTSAAANNCPKSLFAEWTDAATARAKLVGSFDANSALPASLATLGWHTQPSLPCPIAQGGGPPLSSPSAASDLYGTKRDDPVSLGAEEVNAACVGGPPGG